MRPNTPLSGAVAQLGERVVRNDEVVGSIPIGSTISFRSAFRNQGFGSCQTVTAAKSSSRSTLSIVPDIVTSPRRSTTTESARS